jgi:hypothetical protein
LIEKGGACVQYTNKSCNRSAQFKLAWYKWWFLLSIFFYLTYAYSDRDINGNALILDNIIVFFKHAYLFFSFHLQKAAHAGANSVADSLYKNKSSLEVIFRILDKDNSGIT